jgi:hypothetical protein
MLPIVASPANAALLPAMICRLVKDAEGFFLPALFGIDLVPQDIDYKQQNIATLR